MLPVVDEAPVPVRLTVKALPLPGVTVRVAVRVPLAAGVNVTLMVQLPRAATLEPQVFVCAKSALLVPEIAIPLMLRAELVAFVNVTVCAALVVPTVWLAKVNEVGEMLTEEAVNS